MTPAKAKTGTGKTMNKDLEIYVPTERWIWNMYKGLGVDQGSVKHVVSEIKTRTAP